MNMVQLEIVQCIGTISGEYSTLTQLLDKCLANTSFEVYFVGTLFLFIY